MFFVILFPETCIMFYVILRKKTFWNCILCELNIFYRTINVVPIERAWKDDSYNTKYLPTYKVLEIRRTFLPIIQFDLGCIRCRCSIDDCSLIEDISPIYNLLGVAHISWVVRFQVVTLSWLLTKIFITINSNKQLRLFGCHYLVQVSRFTVNYFGLWLILLFGPQSVKQHCKIPTMLGHSILQSCCKLSFCCGCKSKLPCGKEFLLYL